MVFNLHYASSIGNKRDNIDYAIQQKVMVIQMPYSLYKPTSFLPCGTYGIGVK